MEGLLHCKYKFIAKSTMKLIRFLHLPNWSLRINPDGIFLMQLFTVGQFSQVTPQPLMCIILDKFTNLILVPLTCIFYFAYQFSLSFSNRQWFVGKIQMMVPRQVRKFPFRQKCPSRFQFSQFLYKWTNCPRFEVPITQIIGVKQSIEVWFCNSGFHRGKSCNRGKCGEQGFEWVKPTG